MTNPNFIPVFTSAEGKAEVMRTDQAVMGNWLVLFRDPVQFSDSASHRCPLADGSIACVVFVSSWIKASYPLV